MRWEVFLYIFISRPWQLFVLQIVFALGTACLSAPLIALFAKYITKGKEGLQWGIEGSGSYIIVGMAVFIGTFIVHQWGLKNLFLIMFVIQIMVVLTQVKLYFSTAKK